MFGSCCSAGVGILSVRIRSFTCIWMNEQPIEICTFALINLSMFAILFTVVHDEKMPVTARNSGVEIFELRKRKLEILQQVMMRIAI